MTCSRHIHDVLAEEALVLALEGLGRIPVEDGDEWLQPCHEIIFYYYVGVILTKYICTQMAILFCTHLLLLTKVIIKNTKLNLPSE